MTMRRLAFSLLLGFLAVPSWGQASRDCTTTNTVRILCGDINSLDGVTALTMATWVEGDTSTTTKIIGGKHDGAVNANSNFIMTTDATELPGFSVYSGAGAAFTATGSTAINDSARWYCLVGTFDTARTDSVEVEIWVNGIREAQGAGPNAALNSTATQLAICNHGGGAGFTLDYEESVAHLAVEARAWSEEEIKDYCAGNLAQAQRAAGGTGGYLPMWDNAADPGTYIGMGLFSGVCTAATDPGASAAGPPAFIPGGGQ